MTDYKKYINALRKCAKEHEDDRTSFGHIIVSDLCRDTANLLESLEQEPCDCISRAELLKAVDTWDKFGCDADSKLVPYKDCYVPYIHYDDVVKAIKGMPSVQPKITGHEDCISRQAVLDLVENMTDQFGVEHRVITEGVISMLPPVTPKSKTDVLDKIRAEIEQNAYPIVHGVNNHEKGMTLYGILEVIDKYKTESEE